MGIVAAQCRVFIAQNDICAPRPLYYHLFLLDNRHVPSRFPPHRLPDSLPLSSIPPPFHVPYRLVSSLDPLFEPPSGPSLRRFRHMRAFPHRLSGVSCAVPAGFPLVPLSVFHLSSSSPQSESRREGRSVSSDAVRPMPSLRFPFRSPARWTRRVVFRSVGRGGRQGILWKVSCETWTLSHAFLYAVRCRLRCPSVMLGVPVRWMGAVPCRHHAMRGVPYMSVLQRFPFSVN